MCQCAMIVRMCIAGSFVPQQVEILLPPNSRFDVTAVQDRGDGFCEVHLNEVKPSDPILAFGLQGDQLACFPYTTVDVGSFLTFPCISIFVFSLSLSYVFHSLYCVLCAC